MGSSLSLKLFELVNDIHIALGSGVLGLAICTYNRMSTDIGKALCIGTLTGTCLYYAFLTKEKIVVTPEKVIFITGCDSGLGFSLAQHACALGFTVIAGCLNINSDGAKQLDQISNKNIVLLEIDITKHDHVQNAVTYIENYFKERDSCEFWALINNAGVMVFGEFEWNTERLIKQQLDVNLFGTMNLTKSFLPLIRKHSARIITISSHCANATLPGLSVYGATKSALSAWSDGLRVELQKYGVDVITFIPGSFVQQSNIMSNQNDNVYEMQSAMSEEQLHFYGDYFKQYNAYLSALSGYRNPTKIDDFDLYSVFERTLIDKQPSASYIHESWRYKLFHTLFKISPTTIRDFLVVYFIQMPEWRPNKKYQNNSYVTA